MGKNNLLDHILHFLLGGFNPILILISINTTWGSMTTPLIVVGFLWGGCSNLVSLRKVLYNTPAATLPELPNKDVNKPQADYFKTIKSSTLKPLTNTDLGDEN